MANDSQRVVVVSQHYPPDRSGNASRISDTCSDLSSEGWEVTVLSPPPAFPHGEFEQVWRRKTTSSDEGVVVHRLWAWQPTADDPGFLSRIAYYLTFPIHAFVWLLFNAGRYDAIVTSSPPIFTGLAALPFGLLGRKPWLVDVRDLWIDASISLGFIDEGGLLERLSRAYERVVLRTADRVTVTTTVLGDRLVETYGIEREKLVHLPNGVDTGEFRPTRDDPDPEIVYTGNVGHAQALEACILAMDELDEQDAVLKIVGDGDTRGELERLVAEEGLQDRVEFTGLVPREAIPEIINDAMVGVAPLKSDEALEYAVPTKAYEYMSCERPVVATGTGEIEALLAGSDGGIFVDDHAESIADALDALLMNPEKREELGENGREHMLEQYERRIVATRLATVLNGVTGE